jgi:hypothetical protein
MLSVFKLKRYKLAKIKKERQNSFADLKPGNSYPISLGNRFDQTKASNLKDLKL